MQIDDPTNSIAIHLPASIWGLIALSLVVEKDTLLELTYNQSGILRGGSLNFVVAQLVSIFTIGIWAAATTFLMLILTQMVTRMRVTKEEEVLGNDLVEHNVDYRSNDDTLLPLSISHVLSLGLKPEGMKYKILYERFLII